MGRGRFRSRGRASRVLAATVTALAALAAVSAPTASAQASPGQASNGGAKAGSGGAGPASWQRYVVAPSSRAVKPVRVLSSAGNVTNPDGVLGRGVTTLTSTPPPVWPTGTTAAASSCHAPNTGDNGQPRTYVPGNAIDGNTGTF